MEAVGPERLHQTPEDENLIRFFTEIQISQQVLATDSSSICLDDISDRINDDSTAAFVECDFQVTAAEVARHSQQGIYRARDSGGKEAGREHAGTPLPWQWVRRHTSVNANQNVWGFVEIEYSAIKDRRLRRRKKRTAGTIPGCTRSGVHGEKVTGSE